MAKITHDSKVFTKTATTVSEISNFPLKYFILQQPTQKKLQTPNAFQEWQKAEGSKANGITLTMHNFSNSPQAEKCY